MDPAKQLPRPKLSAHLTGPRSAISDRKARPNSYLSSSKPGPFRGNAIRASTFRFTPTLNWRRVERIRLSVSRAAIVYLSPIRRTFRHFGTTLVRDTRSGSGATQSEIAVSPAVSPKGEVLRKTTHGEPPIADASARSSAPTFRLILQ